MEGRSTAAAVSHGPRAVSGPEYVDVATRDGVLRAPHALLLTTWSDAARHCSTVKGSVVVSCFREFPSFPVEAALSARMRGDNTLFWMLLRRLDSAHQALHARDGPSPTSDPAGYTVRLEEYGSLLVASLFLLAACHRLHLTWNEGIVVEKLSSQLSLRTLPVVYDTAARFRYDSGASSLRLLGACHDMFVREGWRYADDTRRRLEMADGIYGERRAVADGAAAAATATGADSSSVLAADQPAPADDAVTRATTAPTSSSEEKSVVRALEAQLRSVKEQIVAQRQRNEAAFAAAQEQRLAEVEDALARAHDRVSAMEAGLCASRELTAANATVTDSELLASPQERREREEGSRRRAIPDAGPAVYAAAMSASKEELTRYLTEMRTALKPPRTLEELTRDVTVVFEVAAEREAGSRRECQQQLETLLAQSMERARETALVRQRLAQAIEDIEADLHVTASAQRR